MGASKLWKFGGMLPAWEEHLIPEGQADTAQNCYLFSGALTGWRQPSLLRQLNNSAAQFTFRIPSVTQSVATAYLVFVGVPIPGDQITLGEIVYTWATGTLAPYQVLIGSTSTACATNLYAAFTFDNNVGTNQGILYGNNTSRNPAIATLNETPGYNNQVLPNTNLNAPAVQVVAPDFGAAFNNTPVAESTNNVRTTWLSDLNSTAHTTTTFVGGTNPTFNSSITAPSAFMEFLDPDTTVSKSQVVEDAFKRFYIASPSVQPLYNTTNRILAGLPAFDLGINPPGCAPSVSVSGGGNTGTLGATTASGVNVDAGANTVYLIPITPTGAVQLQDVSFVPASTDTKVQWQTCLYQDVNEGGSPSPTAPGLLLNVSPLATGIVGGSTTTGSFVNPSGLSANVPYWIGFMLNTTETLAQSTSPQAMFAFSNTFSGGFPINAPAINQVAGTPPPLQMWGDFLTTDIIEARAYVYTWISAYGEESAPSPVTLTNGWSNGTWTIGLFNPPPDDLGINRNLAILRLYRTVTGSTGLTTYYLVADISLGSADPDAIAFVNADVGCLPPAATYVDNNLDVNIALNVQLPSTTYFPPPEELQGFVTMPNGVIAAWKSNEVWFCQPYFPHAWPPGNVIAVDFPVVGLGVTLGAVVVCTSANSYVISGVTPGQMSLNKCSKPEPCTSRGSIVSLESGVYYISPNGLIVVPNTGQLQNLTQSWIKKEDWNALVPQKNTRALALATTYFCWGTTNGSDTSVAQQGFNIALDTDDQASFSIWPQPGGHRLGFMSMTSPLGFNINNLYIDPWTGQAVMIMNQQEYWYDFTNPNPIIQTYQWKSKKYQEVARKNYSALRVFCQVPSTTPPQNSTANTAPPYDPSWTALGPNQWAIVRVYADPQNNAGNGSMQLVMARELRKNGQIMRLPDGYKAENWQIEVYGRVVITNIQMATSVQELGEV
jgi:hypothetical protein